MACLLSSILLLLTLTKLYLHGIRLVPCFSLNTNDNVLGTPTHQQKLQLPSTMNHLLIVNNIVTHLLQIMAANPSRSPLIDDSLQPALKIGQPTSNLANRSTCTQTTIEAKPLANKDLLALPTYHCFGLLHGGHHRFLACIQPKAIGLLLGLHLLLVCVNLRDPIDNHKPISQNSIL